MRPGVSRGEMNKALETRLDGALEGMLYALLAFGPLAFGVVHAWSEEVVILIAAALSTAFLLKLVLFREVRLVWTWAYAPVAIFLMVAALDLLLLPTPLVQTLSPNTVAVKTELLSDLPNAEETLSSMTLSFYPCATRHDLRLVLAVAAVFVVVVNSYHDSAKIKRLLAAIATVGGGVALLALAQDLVGNGKIYWSVPTYDGMANCGPFINHGHYGQFMSLSVGAALALLLVLVHEAFAGHRVTPARVAEFLSSPAARTMKVLLAMMVVGVATVFVSLTRGGMVSMLVAAGFTTLMLGRRRSLQGRGWIMVLLALGAFLCVLWVGFDQVYDRMASLGKLSRTESGRGQIVRDVALVWTKFPVLGAGLGSHAAVYPMFDRSTLASWPMHAENEYAQAAEETGSVGLLALVLFGVAVWFHYAKSVSMGSVPIRSAAYGLGFGLLAILIHSLSDFGQHLPVNAVLSAVTCALLIVLGRTGGRNEKAWTRAAKHPTLSRMMILVLVAAVWVWAVGGADRARIAEVHWNQVLAAERLLEADQWRAAPETYDYLFTHAIAAVVAEPDNIQYRHWLGAYKWLSLTLYTDPNTQRLREEALPWARQVADELLKARVVCPTFGATYCLAGEIENFVLLDPNGADHIRQGYRLAPCDVTACFAAARIDAAEGKIGEAFTKLTRAVQLDGRLFRQATQWCIRDLGRDDLALKLAKEDPDRLAYVGNVVSASGGVVPLPNTTQISGPSNLQVALEARAKAFGQLQERCARADAPGSAHAALANLYQERGDAETAVQHYRQALMKDYAQVGWHYALAQLLANQGRHEEAIHEARICLRLQPDYSSAQRLIEQLSMAPNAVR